MNAPNPKNASITLIGPAMRIDGRIDFSGVLRVHGEIAGEVLNSPSGPGMLVVEDSGRITGTVVAPHVVLKGQILGSVESAGLVEIHRGGRVCGDVAYRQVDVRSGGVVEGKLMPAASAPADQPLAKSSSSSESIADALPGETRGRRHNKLVWGAAALAIVAVGVIWMRPASHTIKPVGVDLSSPGDTAPTTSPALVAAPPPVAPPTEPAAAPKPVAEPAPPPMPATPPPAAAPPATPAAAPVPTPDRGRWVTVQGTNPEKSASQFYVTTHEAVVLQRKKRGDPGEGKSVEIAKNRNTSLQIGANEIFRVAQGHNVDIFYQGRRVSKPNIDNGDWLSFVPFAAGN